MSEDELQGRFLSMLVKSEKSPSSELSLNSCDEDTLSCVISSANRSCCLMLIKGPLSPQESQRSLIWWSSLLRCFGILSISHLLEPGPSLLRCLGSQAISHLLEPVSSRIASPAGGRKLYVWESINDVRSARRDNVRPPPRAPQKKKAPKVGRG